MIAVAPKAKVKYWDSRGGYYARIKGVQTRLATGPKDEPNGPTYAAAVKLYAQLTCDVPGSKTLNALAAEYLAWVAVHRQPNTLSIRREGLAVVCAHFGEHPVNGLTARSVESWMYRVAEEREWAPSTIRMRLESLHACLAWAQEGNEIPTNPVAGLEMPETESRGLECVLDPDQVAKVLAACRGGLQGFVQALSDTGARPGELMLATAQQYDAHLQAIVYPAKPRKGQTRHKTQRTGRPRVIYLSGPTADLVGQLAERHPSGPLFRRGVSQGRPAATAATWGWTHSALHPAFETLRRRTGIQHLIPYSFRHTYAVRWLRAGKPVEALAAVLGTSVEVLRDHYFHLCDQHSLLRGLVEDQQTR